MNKAMLLSLAAMPLAITGCATGGYYGDYPGGYYGPGYYDDGPSVNVAYYDRGYYHHGYDHGYDGSNSRHYDNYHRSDSNRHTSWASNRAAVHSSGTHNISRMSNSSHVSGGAGPASVHASAGAHAK